MARHPPRKCCPTLVKKHGEASHIITLCRHEDGRPVAMTVARGKKEDTSQRLAGATQALKETPFLN